MPAHRPTPLMFPADDLAMHGRAVVRALQVCIALNAVYLATYLVAFAGYLTGDSDMGDTVAGIATFSEWVYGVEGLGVAVTAVLFLVWLYRARLNLELVAPGQLRNSPGWLLASWFVPFASIWFPYDATREVWRLSGVYGGLDGQRAYHGLGWWWLCWAIYTVAYSANAEDAGEAIVVAGVFGIVSGLLAIRVVRELTRRQEVIFSRLDQHARAAAAQHG